jgi:hypothetical protein
MPRLLGNVFLPASEVNQILQKLSELLKYAPVDASSRALCGDQVLTCSCDNVLCRFIAKAEYVDMKCYVPVEEVSNPRHDAAALSWFFC